MSEERNESPTLGALAAALAKAQGAMEAAKKASVNPHFGSSYADLASIMDVCRGPLSANGLAVMQRVSTCADGVRITTQLVHTSGEWVKDTCVMPLGARTAQAVGSAITYGRRYALAALVGIAAEEDDDGEAASKGGAPRARPASNGVKDTVKAQAKGEAPKETVNPRTGEVLPAVFPNYGRSKGAPIHGASAQDLDFYAAAARKSLADPSKARFHDKERALLTAIEGEMMRQRRGSESEYPDDVPPPTDADAPPH